MPNGIIIIDKPADWTSQDVCAKLRGVFREKRIGHGGTLDPMATGVLPVFVGRATRAVEFSTEGEKEYLAGLHLGTVTDTQDTSGRVLQEAPASVTADELEHILAAFRGELDQIPPMYSAIKIGGKKLYELARKGREVERPARHITVFSLKIEGQSSPADFLLRVRCSKGTYVRTLCHDIGAALGCGGCMSSLRRTMAAGFTLEDAVPLSDVLSTEDPARLLRPVESCFSSLPAFTLTDALDEKRLRNGAPVPLAGKETPQGPYRVYSAGGEFLALGRTEQDTLLTIKSFFEV